MDRYEPLKIEAKWQKNWEDTEAFKVTEKDGTPKKIVHNKKKGKSSEVFPIQIPDIKKILHYFEI